MHVHLLVPRPLHLGRLQVGEGHGQRLDAARLAAARGPDDHEAVPDADHLIKLNVLAHEYWHRLQILPHHRVLQRRHQGPVVERRPLDAREQIGKDAVEEREVVREELWDVDVLERAKQESLFLLVGRRLLQVAGGGDDRLHRAHAVVVMVLARELLGAQTERGHHLLRAFPTVHVPKGEQHDLADQSIVGDHHRHGPEQRL
mmetsp:Transcript_24770/g.85502  ORF Transcript_24770/g.85502 Transcript_24770/m.85502 type:complete len:202 (+) Transcript_24770:5936-6541(+)